MIQQLKRDVAEVLSTAWPLMLSTGLFSVTLFVDRMLLYRYTEGAAAAAMAAGTLFWSLTCLPTGVCGYTNAFVSQYLAAKRPDRALQVVWQGILLAFCVCPILIGFGLGSKAFFLYSGHAPELAAQESAYFNWLIPGSCATVVSAALIGLYAGSGRTRVLVVSDVIATAINIILDLVFIFGWWGMPEMGAGGAALASSISLLFKLLVLILFALPDFKSGWVRRRNPKSGRLEDAAIQTTDSVMIADGVQGSPPHVKNANPVRNNEDKRVSIFNWILMKRLMRFGWPAGVSVVAEAWSFTIIMMIVGKLGERPAAATTLALGVNLIAFIPLIGLGTAVGVLVGKYLVEEKPDVAKRMVFSGLLIGLTYSFFFVVFYGGFPDLAMNVYALDIDSKRFEEMRPVLRPLLYFIASYCVFDAFQTVYVGALKGAGDTYFVLGGHVFAGSTAVLGGLLVSYLTGYNGLYYWWSVISVWVILLAIIFTGRYLQGGWLTKRVIEPIVVES